jgi:hypothetical protein
VSEQHFKRSDFAAAVRALKDLGQPRDLIPSMAFEAFKGSRIHALFLAAAALSIATEGKP